MSRPEAVTKVVDGKVLEPVEHLTIDTTEAYIGPVTESLASRQAQLVNGRGAPLGRLEVPGATTVHFTADGPHIVLADLQRPVERGETFIVTLMFQKSGGIGIVTLLE